jgi:hypothetical protein
MGKHVGHRLDPLGIDGLGHVDVEDSGDAAHGLFAARRAIGELSMGPSAATKASIAARGAPAVVSGVAETSTATACCEPPINRTFIVSSFTRAALPVRISPTR